MSKSMNITLSDKAIKNLERYKDENKLGSNYAAIDKVFSELYNKRTGEMKA
ncbi:MAG: hypothetical protein Q8M94_22525 [Ignavibacteria bacterium]|nr:hypothetical protein [Ignavibacteria bacterium]